MLYTCGSFLFCSGMLCLLMALVLRLTRGEPSAAPARTYRQTVTRRPATSPAAIRQINLRPAAAPASAQPRVSGSMQDQVFNAQPGQTATFRHPHRGELSAKVLGVIHYQELWQQSRGANAPWVPTGNTFAALWMGDYMLYEWQSRLYLFDEAQALTDQDIHQSFLPYAKQFAQSNQTAKVTFAWPPTTWTVADIGKFAVTRAEGAGLRLNLGAQGRFIHATADDRRVLVVEDYQSGGSGGLDSLWLGWQITWDDVIRLQ